MKTDDYYDEPTELDREQQVKGDDAGDTETALLPKSVLRGYKCEVGDKLVLRVNGIYDDEVAVTVEREQKGSEAKGDEDENESALSPTDEEAASDDAALAGDATSAAPANDMYA